MADDPRLVLYREWTDKHGIRRLERVGEEVDGINVAYVARYAWLRRNWRALATKENHRFSNESCYVEEVSVLNGFPTPHGFSYSLDWAIDAAIAKETKK